MVQPCSLIKGKYAVSDNITAVEWTMLFSWLPKNHALGTDANRSSVVAQLRWVG